MKTFLVVYQIGEEFRSFVESADAARGIRPDYVWLFGMPKTDEEHELADVAKSAAVMTGLLPEYVLSDRARKFRESLGKGSAQPLNSSPP